MSFLSQPEDAPGTRPDQERIARDAADAWAALLVAKEGGWTAVVPTAFANAGALTTLLAARTHQALAELNNLLLPALFTLITLELVSGWTASAASEYQLLSILFFVAFFGEWMIGLMLARSRSAYLTNGWLLADMLSSLPLTSAFQVLRLARVARLFRVVKLVRLLRGRGFRLPIAPIARAFGITFSVALAGALALHAMEPGAAPSFGDAMWWSTVTITTVGYGDISPATPAGRLVAVLLMVVGVGVFGYVAGAMSSAMFDEEEDEILTRVRRIDERLDALTAQLDSGTE